MLETSCLESNTNYGVWSFKIEHVVKKAFGSMWLEVLEISQHYKKRTLDPKKKKKQKTKKK
jgi:hypothetical protein